MDLSAASLHFCAQELRQRGLHALLLPADMTVAVASLANSFDCAHIMVSSFKYLLTETSAVNNLEAIHAMLRPGGVYIIGMHVVDYG
jgi:hypothetical protein